MSEVLLPYELPVMIRSIRDLLSSDLLSRDEQDQLLMRMLDEYRRRVRAEMKREAIAVCHKHEQRNQERYRTCREHEGETAGGDATMSHVDSTIAAGAYLAAGACADAIGELE